MQRNKINTENGSALKLGRLRMPGRIRTMEQSGLEATFEGHQIQFPFNEEGHLQLDLVA